MIGTPADDVLDRTTEISGAGTEAHATTPVEAQVEKPEVEEARVAGTPREVAPAPARPNTLARIGGWLPRAWQFFITQGFSSLTRRIVFLNVAGLLALSIGITFLSQFRAGLIDARVQSLLVQGQIIAGAIAASATVETDSSITIDPDKLLDLQPGESYGPSEEALYGIDFSDQSRARSPRAAAARLADQDARAHLRS